MGNRREPDFGLLARVHDISASPTVILGQLPLSPHATRAIELADETASQFGRGGIGTEPLLLGLLKENEGIAAQALIHLGIELDEVRDMVRAVLAALYSQSCPREREEGDLGPPPVPGSKLG